MKFSFVAACILLAACNLFAQNQEQLDSLYALLPKVKDTTEVNVLYSIARFEFDRDPPKALHISQESLTKAKVLKFRGGQVMAYKQIGVFHNLYKNSLDSARLFLDSAEALATTAAQRVSVYSALGALLSRKGEFEKSHAYLMKALDLIPDKESRAAFNTYTYLALNLSMLGRYREATPYYRKCLYIADRSRNLRDVGIALDNLGLNYVNREEYDSAGIVYKRLYNFEIKHGNPLQNPTMLSELGKVYFEKGKTDSAYYFMHAALRAAYVLNIPYAITRSLSNLARYHLKNHADSALFYGRKLRREINHSSALALEDAYYILARAHGKLKHYDSAFHYFDQYQIYHDSVFQEKQTRQIAELEAKYALKTQQEEIKQLETAHQADVLKRKVLVAGLALAVLICILIFFVLRGRIRARKKEIEIKNWQLESYTRKMIEKSELVEELRAQVDQFKSEITVPKERIENVSRILNSPLLTDDDWEQFKIIFEQVHRNFFAGLKLKYPFLTQAEIRLAALVKLNLSTREMANMLGISADSANKARYRLRKKLELQPEQDLQEIIEKIAG